MASLRAPVRANNYRNLGYVSDKLTTPEEKLDKALEEKLDKALEEKFSKVNISKSKLSFAKAALKKVTSNRMESKLFLEKCMGLSADKIDVYAEKVIPGLGLAKGSVAENQVASAFAKMELVDKKKGGVYSKVEELKLDVKDENEFKCIYGAIAAIRSEGSISVAYAHSCKKCNH